MDIFNSIFSEKGKNILHIFCKVSDELINNYVQYASNNCETFQTGVHVSSDIYEFLIY